MAPSMNSGEHITGNGAKSDGLGQVYHNKKSQTHVMVQQNLHKLSIEQICKNLTGCTVLSYL